MRTLGNILWHIPLLGFLNAGFAYLSGLLLAATGVGAPIGLGLMEYGKFLLAPFSRAMISKSELGVEQKKAWKIFSTIIAIFYIITFGIILSVITLVQAVFLCFTIFGIPVAVVLAKSLGTIFNPVNKKCVSWAVADELAREKARKEIEKRQRRSAKRS